MCLKFRNNGCSKTASPWNAWNSQTKDCKQNCILSLVLQCFSDRKHLLFVKRSHPEFHRGSSWRPRRPRMSHCSPTSSTTCVTSGRRTSWRRPDRERRWTIDSNWNCQWTIEKWIRVFGNCLFDWEQAHVFNRTFNLLHTIWIYLILFVSTSPQRQHCISLLDSSMRRGIGATPNCQKALWVGIKTCFFRTKSSNFGMFSWWSMVMAMALFSGQWIVKSVEFAWFYVCIGLRRCLVLYLPG